MESNSDICPACGSQLKPGDKFCRGCGREVGGIRARSIPLQAMILMFTAVTALFGFIIYSVVTAKPEPKFVHPDVEGMGRSAMMDMQDFVESLPSDYAGLVAQGNVSMDHGRYAEAVVCYDRALETSDTSADVRTDLGACYHALGEIDSALVQFEQALRLDPDHAVAHFNMGVVYHTLGDMTKTKQYWTRYLELMPESPIADTLKTIMNSF
jgi:cytochrome c-type biogenesis protein CcmH/NrfG